MANLAHDPACHVFRLANCSMASYVLSVAGPGVRLAPSPSPYPTWRCPGQAGIRFGSSNIALPPGNHVHQPGMHHWRSNLRVQDSTMTNEIWKFDKRFYTDAKDALKVPKLPLPPPFNESETLKVHDGTPWTKNLHGTMTLTPSGLQAVQKRVVAVQGMWKQCPEVCGSSAKGDAWCGAGLPLACCR
eukprot:363275-Chlamydomonas_euryale.AAC.3